MSEATYVCTLTVAFGIDDDTNEDAVREMFLEWLGSVSDNWILEGLEVSKE